MGYYNSATGRTSPVLNKRRNNYTRHDPEMMDYLVHFNDWVGLYLWYGLIGIIGIVTFLHWAGKLQVSEPVLVGSTSRTFVLKKCPTGSGTLSTS